MIISVSLLKDNQRLPQLPNRSDQRSNQRAHVAGMVAGLECRNTMLFTAWKCRISVWLVAIMEASSGDPISRFAAPHVGVQLGPRRLSSRESCPVGLPCSPPLFLSTPPGSFQNPPGLPGLWAAAGARAPGQRLRPRPRSSPVACYHARYRLCTKRNP